MELNYLIIIIKKKNIRKITLLQKKITTIKKNQIWLTSKKHFPP
jgi:hypothetical protein